MFTIGRDWEITCFYTFADPFAFSRAQIRTFLDDAYGAADSLTGKAGHESFASTGAYEDLDQVAVQPEPSRRVK